MPRPRLAAWYRAHAEVAQRRWRPAAGESALDLLHDAVVDLLERPPASVRSPIGFLLAAARSLASDRWRRGATSARVHEELGRAAAPAQAHAPDQDGDLLCALEALPGPCRDALVLSRVEGLTHREIAAHQGTSVRTVRRRIDQALAALQERLEDQDG